MNYEQALKEPESLPMFSTVPSTGFKYHEIGEGEVFSTDNKQYSHILFLLEGEMKMSCNEFINRQVREKEFVLIPVAADVKCKVISRSRILQFTFEDFLKYFDKNYILQLQSICMGSHHLFTKLPFCEPIDNFIHHLSLYVQQNMDKRMLQDIKQMELLVILQSFYSKEEIAAFFYPLIGKSYSFRMKVLRYYREEQHVEGLAERLGLEKRSFSRQFKEEFDVSPYQWLLNQKAKHIRFSLAESDKTLDDIRKEFGFKFAGHFTRFCKDQFSCTPVKLRRQLAYEE